MCTCKYMNTRPRKLIRTGGARSRNKKTHAVATPSPNKSHATHHSWCADRLCVCVCDYAACCEGGRKECEELTLTRIRSTVAGSLPSIWIVMIWCSAAPSCSRLNVSFNTVRSFPSFSCGNVVLTCSVPSSHQQHTSTSLPLSSAICLVSLSILTRRLRRGLIRPPY